MPSALWRPLAECKPTIFLHVLSTTSLKSSNSSDHFIFRSSSDNNTEPPSTWFVLSKRPIKSSSIYNSNVRPSIGFLSSTFSSWIINSTNLPSWISISDQLLVTLDRHHYFTSSLNYTTSNHWHYLLHNFLCYFSSSREVENVSNALRAECARGDGRIKRKEDDRRKNIKPSDTLFVVGNCSSIHCGVLPWIVDLGTTTHEPFC